MTIPNFQLGYPPDGSSLGSTKLQMRDNIDGTILTLSVDHRNANQTTPGYHTIIHQQTQTSVNTVANVNQVFSGSPNSLIVNGSPVAAIPNSSDTQLYSLTGAGGLSQLTGNFANQNGFTWIGGILLQWGKATAPGSVSFNSNPNNYDFPNTCFNVQVTGILAGATSATPNFYVSSVTSTKFTIATNNSGSPTGYNIFWVAIGN